MSLREDGDLPMLVRRTESNKVGIPFEKGTENRGWKLAEPICL